MKGKRIILTVSNDLVSDQRVNRTADTLSRQGADVLVIGRELPHSQGTGDRSYAVRRLRLLFRKGPLFYAFFNMRLFLFLCFRRLDLLVSNDLDTLPACYLVSRIRGIRLAYDSHEYFTGVPELVGRDFTRSIWLRMEKRMLPRLKYASTVSDSVAQAYHRDYGIRMEVIRNLPEKSGKEARRPDKLPCYPKRVIFYQGALNVGRGLEHIISAMQYLDRYHLQMAGDGDIKEELEMLVAELGLSDRVEFLGRLPFRELRVQTRQASLGISLEEDLGLNYRYALPNKLFDYIQAGIPVLVSDLPEMRKIIETYAIGEILKERNPQIIARQVSRMMESDDLRINWKKNLRVAADELCWEKEEPKLLNLYRRALQD